MMFSTIKERLAGLETARASLLAVVQRRGEELKVRCVRRGCGRTVEADKAFHHGRDGFCPDHRPPNARPVAESLARILRLVATEEKAASEVARLRRLPRRERQTERLRLRTAVARAKRAEHPTLEAARKAVEHAKELVVKAQNAKTRVHWLGLLREREATFRAVEAGLTAEQRATHERWRTVELARLGEQLAAIRCTFLRAARRAA